MAKLLKKKKATLIKKQSSLEKLKDAVDEYSKKQPESKSNTRTLRQNPSKRYTAWKLKEVDDWTSRDFLFFYLYRYLKEFGMEDESFKPMQDYVSEKARLKYFLKTYCDDNKLTLKKYINWAVKWGASDECWVDSFGFWFVFNKKVTLFKIFRLGKRKSNRKKTDNDWASREVWGEEEE